jgi:hypothetical protein
VELYLHSPNTPSWRGAQLKKAQAQLYLFTFTKYYQDHQVNEDEMSGACITHGRIRNAYKILVGKPEGKRPF